jgi:hypothetical protein
LNMLDSPPLSAPDHIELPRNVDTFRDRE